MRFPFPVPCLIKVKNRERDIKEKNMVICYPQKVDDVTTQSEQSHLIYPSKIKSNEIQGCILEHSVKWLGREHI
jgi:hypothetical protein